jgi:uncharacterized protein (TIGR02452 family)
MLKILPCLDSPEMAARRQQELMISKEKARALARSALEAADRGYYLDLAGGRVEWSRQVQAARAAKRTIPPDAPLPVSDPRPFMETRVQVANETTLGAARRLIASGLKPLALNFANGLNPGGGFLGGARAQEETLCRSSALYQTLLEDPMYDAHALRMRPDSTDWAILSPNVPVFRTDDGTTLGQPYLLSFITCAAPYAPAIGQPESAELL